jgi:cardiolipin synthase
MRFIALLLALVSCAAPPILVTTPDAAGDDLALQARLTAELDSHPPVPGNQVTLLRDGAQTLPGMFAAMRAARDHINLEYYIFDDVHWDGQSLGDLLAGKLAEGVAVQIIYDGYGSRPTPSAFFDRLRKAGAKLLTYHPLDPLTSGTLSNPNDRDHRKILVVDGRVGFVGGVNLDRVYENPRANGDPHGGDPKIAYWRDTDARIEGPAVAELQRLFFDTWEREGGPVLPNRSWYPPERVVGNQAVRVIGSAPGQQQPLYYLALLTSVHAARHSISISSGFFVPSHQMREELAQAARRGVRVRLVLPSDSNSPSALAAGRAAYGDLLEAGAQIYEVRGAVLHSKVAVVDGVWLAIGSSNLDRRSVVFNNEVDAIVVGREAAGQADRLLDEDERRSDEITLEAWRDRDFAERWQEWKARLWEWLL